jgi:hypothetical protein
MQDIVTARAAWNPFVSLSDSDALRASLQPALRPFGPVVGPKLVDFIVRLINAQNDILIFGKIQGKAV